MLEREFRQLIEQQPDRSEPHGAVLNLQEFMLDFGHEASQAREVFTAVMHFEAGEVGSQVVDIFNRAPKDAKKTVIFDAFSELVAGGFILAPYAYLPGRRDEVTRLRNDQANVVAELEETGTEVRVVNEPTGIKDKVFPFTGRSHLKISYSRKKDGQSIAYVHSHNYSDSPSAEVTVKFTGDHAEKIIDVYDDILKNPPTEDLEKQLTDDLWIFVDSGQPGKSVILDKAVSLVKDAQSSIQVCSQLPPDGDFAQALSDANNQDKHVEVVSTDRRLERPLYSDNNIMYVVDLLAGVSSHLHGRSFPMHRDPYRNMHVKLLLKDIYGDAPEAFFGSHNFAPSGVKAGTREVQLLSTDRAIGAALYRRFEDFKITAGREE